MASNPLASEKLGAAEIDFWYNELIRAQITAFILHGDVGAQIPSAKKARTPTGDQAATCPAQPLNSSEFGAFVSHVRANLDTVLAAKTNKESVYLTADEWMSWYDKLFQALIGVATLGAGFTFTIITSAIDKPHDGIDTEYVRRCVSVSWLLFVASLGCTSLAALFLSVNKRTIIRSIDEGDKWYKSWEGVVIVLTTLLVQLLPLGAFAAAAEVVRSYQQGVGIVVMVFIAVLAAVLFLLWLCQNRCVMLISALRPAQT